MKREIAKEWCAYRRRPVDEGTATVTPVSPEEIDAALKNMKCGKAPGYDNIHPEFFKKSLTKSEEMASNISDAYYYLGKEPPQELDNCKNSRHP